MTKKLIKLAIADDHALIRKGLASLLEEEDDLTVLFQAADGHELLTGIRKIKPHVVIMDIEMPVLNGYDTMDHISRLFPTVKVIVLSMHYDEAHVADFIARGACAFLPKNCDIDKVIEAIRAVYNQGYYFDNQVSRSMAGGLSRQHASEPRSAGNVLLTEREIEILRLACEEKTNQEIAETLAISKRTVEGHRKTILDKTNSRNVVGLVMYAIKHSIIPARR